MAMGKDEVQVIGTANIFDLARSIHDDAKAKKLILAIDSAREDVGFTEDLIISLIKEMKKEYKGDRQALLDFKDIISGAL